MLKVRLLTAMVLIPLVIAAVWWFPSWGVAVLVGLLFALGAWEWSQFLPVTGPTRLLWIAMTVLALLLTAPHALGHTMLLPLMIVALVWWLAAAAWLALYPAGFGPQRPSKALRGLVGLLILVPGSAALWGLHEQSQGRELVLLALALVWATDTGGYFAGKRFGRRKLAPLVSPNKTWEGVVGGLAFAALCALVGAMLVFDLPPERIGAFLLTAVAVAAVSIVGDLTISMFKRQCEVKDTGTLFPGHGGVLDRLDSLFSAAPALYLGWYLIVNW